MYNSRITREHRTAIVILSDTSGSMTEEVSFNGEQMTKSEAVAYIVNMFLEELINRSRREEGVRDYFDIALIGYGSEVKPMLPSDKIEFVTPTQLVNMSVGVREYQILRELPNGNQIAFVKKQRCWVNPTASGSTPMGKALQTTESMVQQWCSVPRNKQSFPPMVINITDGEASDSDDYDLCQIAERIKQCTTSDGGALFFNIHLARADIKGNEKVSFPCCLSEIPASRYARTLYDMSSEMPECYNTMLSSFRSDGKPPFKAMSYNCSLDELFSMLTIGSVSMSFKV